MAPEQQRHLTTTAMAYHEGRQVDGARGGAVDPSSAGESCPGGGVRGYAESEAGSEGNAGAAGAEEGNFKSTKSFGSVTQETPTRVRSWTWTIPFMKVIDTYGNRITTVCKHPFSREASRNVPYRFS